MEDKEMSEKKVFSYNPSDNMLLYGLVDKCKFTPKEVVELLNEMVEENSRLRNERARIVELPPQCLVCSEFSYHEGADELYTCKAVCMNTNDLYDMWGECPYIYKKYLVYEG